MPDLPNPPSLMDSAKLRICTESHALCLAGFTKLQRSTGNG